MKRLLLKFLTVTSSEVEPVDLDHSLRVATAILLVEMMRADFKVEDSERQSLRVLLEKQFQLTESELDALLDQAEADAAELVSLQHVTRLLNENYDQAMKLRVVEMMWQVIYADGDKDHYEEHLIRQIADLLYVSHADFIQARHKAEAGTSGSTSS